MIRLEPRMSTAARAVQAHVHGALVLLALLLWAPDAQAYRWYDNGAGSGCVQCHTGFLNGNGPLHLQHRTQFGVTDCNICHPNGGSTKPVLTYWSGPGGGYGCAGCHGQDYGETSPNSGLPKATAYGLRAFHVANGITSCGTSGCHQPGALGHPNPFPTLYGENVAPPYFAPMFTGLTDPCSSTQEDLPFDLDSVGLDNDGDGAADYPADSDCPTPATPTPTPTPGASCGVAPAPGCIASGKGSLQIDEKKTGKEKLKVTLGKLQPAVTQGQFGDPVNGTTVYAVCVYDAADQLRGEYSLVPPGPLCGTKPCWKAVSDKGYQYKDKEATSDGLVQAKLTGGDVGKGQIKIQGKNSSGNLPIGVVAGLMNNPSSATVQVLSSDAACFSIGLTEIKKADGTVFQANGP
ncbi:MAG: hypothetical protein IT294_11420 [Deltaproteobacteria bacterium]|nr:hypothetical protein [Deltaproteobacteria bacterium]